MQKFTRALTREIELGGERLAVTLSAEGLAFRPVGSRRPPHAMTWSACLCACTGHPSVSGLPSGVELARALQALKERPEEAKPAATHTSATPLFRDEPAPPADQAATSLSAVLVRIDNYLAAHRGRFHGGLRPGAGHADLEDLSATLGRPVPTELATLLLWHDGQDVEVMGGFERDWHLMSADEIGATVRELNETKPSGWHAGLVPVFDNDGGSYLVLDTLEHGTPLKSLWAGKPTLDHVAPSLTQWLTHFDAALEAGKYQEDPERGTFFHV